MGETTGIQWTNKTLNLWIGCHRVPGGECDNCYADAGSKRLASQHGLKLWDEGSSRYLTKTAWASVAKWEREAVRLGVTFKVFCASYSDLFEDREDVETRRQTFLTTVVPECPHLTFQLLTKRPENVRRFAPAHWFQGRWPTNVWMGTTVGARSSISRIETLRGLPAPVRFVSVEPLLEDIGDVPGLLRDIQWVIVGGESGHKARPCATEWIANIVQSAMASGAAPFVKQLGTKPTSQGRPLVLKDKHGGDMLEWPEDLRVRQFPIA